MTSVELPIDATVAVHDRWHRVTDIALGGKGVR